MIVDERLVTYINSLDKGNTPILDTIEREALDTYVPIIRKEMQSFLKLLLAMTFISAFAINCLMFIQSTA